LIEYILTGFYILACVVLILFVLLQPGKSDAAAVFGGGASSTAFGPRGTQTVLAKVTIGAAIVFFLIAFLFSIQGLFGPKSLGEGVTPAEVQAPAPAEPAPAEQAPAATPESETKPAAATSESKQNPAPKKEEPKKEQSKQN
jgi:preprotein translocase subunit SecG